MKLDKVICRAPAPEAIRQKEVAIDVDCPKVTPEFVAKFLGLPRPNGGSCRQHLQVQKQKRRDQGVDDGDALWGPRALARFRQRKRQYAAAARSRPRHVVLASAQSLSGPEKAMERQEDGHRPVQASGCKKGPRHPEQGEQVQGRRTLGQHVPCLSAIATPSPRKDASAIEAVLHLAVHVPC